MTLLLLAAASHAQELKLQGKWVMTYDPDGPTAKEWIKFYKNGTVDFGDEQGIFLHCTYDGTPDSILSTCNVRGTEKMMSFKVKNNFKELINPSGSVYTRKDQ